MILPIYTFFFILLYTYKQLRLYKLEFSDLVFVISFICLFNIKFGAFFFIWVASCAPRNPLPMG